MSKTYTVSVAHRERMRLAHARAAETLRKERHGLVGGLLLWAVVLAGVVFALTC